MAEPVQTAVTAVKAFGAAKGAEVGVAVVDQSVWWSVVQSVLDFAATMTGHLAWPIVAVIIASMFKTELLKLLGRVSSLKLGGADVAFHKEIDDFNVAVKELGHQEAEVLEPIVGNVSATLEDATLTATGTVSSPPEESPPPSFSVNESEAASYDKNVDENAESVFAINDAAHLEQVRSTAALLRELQRRFDGLFNNGDYSGRVGLSPRAVVLHAWKQVTEAVKLVTTELKISIVPSPFYPDRSTLFNRQQAEVYQKLGTIASFLSGADLSASHEMGVSAQEGAATLISGMQRRVLEERKLDQDHLEKYLSAHPEQRSLLTSPGPTN